MPTAKRGGHGEEDMEQVVFDDEDVSSRVQRKGNTQPSSMTQLKRKVRSQSAARSGSTANDAGEYTAVDNGDKQVPARSRQRMLGSTTRGGKIKQGIKDTREADIFTEFEELEAIAAKNIQDSTSNNAGTAAAHHSPHRHEKETPQKSSTAPVQVTSSSTRLSHKPRATAATAALASAFPPNTTVDDGADAMPPLAQRDPVHHQRQQRDYGNGGDSDDTAAEDDEALRATLLQQGGSSRTCGSSSSARAPTAATATGNGTKKARSAGAVNAPPKLAKSGKSDLGRPAHWGATKPRPARAAANKAGAAASRGGGIRATASARSQYPQSGQAGAGGRHSPSMSPSAASSKQRQPVVKRQKLMSVADDDVTNPDLFGNMPKRPASRDRVRGGTAGLGFGLGGNSGSRAAQQQGVDAIVEVPEDSADLGIGIGIGIGGNGHHHGGGGAGFDFTVGPTLSSYPATASTGTGAYAPGVNATAFVSQAAASSSSSIMYTQQGGLDQQQQQQQQQHVFAASYSINATHLPPAPSSSHHHGRAGHAGGAAAGEWQRAPKPVSVQRTQLEKVQRGLDHRLNKFYMYQSKPGVDAADPRKSASVYVDMVLVRKERLVEAPMLAFLAYVPAHGVVVQNKKQQQQQHHHHHATSPSGRNDTTTAGGGGSSSGAAAAVSDLTNANVSFSSLAAPTAALEDGFVFVMFRGNRDKREAPLQVMNQEQQQGQEGFSFYRIYDPVVKWVSAAGVMNDNNHHPGAAAPAAGAGAGAEEGKEAMSTVPSQPQGTAWGVTEPLRFPCLFATQLVEQQQQQHGGETLDHGKIQSAMECWPDL